MPEKQAHNVPKERSHLKLLLAENANYFGNLTNSDLKPVKKIIANVEFEELTCVGYNPESQNLEATIAIKLSYGYGGSLCQLGSTEFVRFFVDYGSGWEDAGLTGVQVNDVPDGLDCAQQGTKPLSYVATLKYSPKAECCTHAVLPKLRAILSWQVQPPPGGANAGWHQPWGNTMDCNIQIKPRPWDLLCLIEEIGATIGQKLELPANLKAIANNPIPIPDPPPFTLGQVAKLYGGQASEAKAAKQAVFSVEPHRFALPYLQSITSASGFNQAQVEGQVAQLKYAGIDLGALLKALDDTKANVTYEELECLGLDETFPERLVATFRVKKSSGYSGTLCQNGSTEYVAFWADWDNTCEWSYLGTAKVNVHDFTPFPPGGLCYSAILPVDLTYHRRPCDSPKIARIRAVLSWESLPSTVDPDALNTWGNRVDRHVVIEPGEVMDPGEPDATLRNIGGIPIEDIDTSATGLTISTAVFAHYPWVSADGWGLGRPCPFGGRLVMEGNYYPGFFYRVVAHKLGDPYSSFTVLGTSFDVERTGPGFDTQISIGGFFSYLDPLTHFDRILAVWDSVGDAEWDIQLQIATAPADVDIFTTSPWYRVQLDNTRPLPPPAFPPTIDIHILTGGGDCTDVTQAADVNGDFIADDAYFGAWSLSTEPNTLSTPSNQPIVLGLAATDPAPWPAGHAWLLHTNTPVAMKPCGYVVRLDVSDRSIVNSYPGSHNANNTAVGFCLRAK